MKKNLEAVKTEYNGIVFRSKSEAIFARSLDILIDLNKKSGRNVDIKYYYEPLDPSTFDDGYIPDFIITHKCNGCNTVKLHIIEYKPKRPTDTYLKNLQKKARRLLNAISSIDSLYDAEIEEVRFFVVYGNPFGDCLSTTITYCYNCDCFHEMDNTFIKKVYDKHGVEEFNYNFIGHLWEEAKKYRFDLSQ